MKRTTKAKQGVAIALNLLAASLCLPANGQTYFPKEPIELKCVFKLLPKPIYLLINIEKELPGQGNIVNLETGEVVYPVVIMNDKEFLGIPGGDMDSAKRLIGAELESPITTIIISRKTKEAAISWFPKSADSNPLKRKNVSSTGKCERYKSKRNF